MLIPKKPVGGEGLTPEEKDMLVRATKQKDTWLPSTGVFPTETKANEQYIAADDGVVNGIDFKVGDTVTSLVTTPSTTVYKDNWLKADNTDPVEDVEIVLWADLSAGLTALGAGMVGKVVTISAGKYDFANATSGSNKDDYKGIITEIEDGVNVTLSLSGDRVPKLLGVIGDMLYLDTVDGNVTTTQPSSPDSIIEVGYNISGTEMIIY